MVNVNRCCNHRLKIVFAYLQLITCHIIYTKRPGCQIANTLSTIRALYEHFSYVRNLRSFMCLRCCAKWKNTRSPQTQFYTHRTNVRSNIVKGSIANGIDESRLRVREHIRALDAAQWQGYPCPWTENCTEKSNISIHERAIFTYRPFHQPYSVYMALLVARVKPRCRRFALLAPGRCAYLCICIGAFVYLCARRVYVCKCGVALAAKW